MLSSGEFAVVVRLCRIESVISCCPGGFLHSSCLRLRNSETSCRTFIMLLAPCAIFLYAATGVRLSAVHSFFVMESFSRIVCMRAIIPLLQLSVYTLPESVHDFSSCKIPVSSFASRPSSVPVRPLGSFL